HVIIMRLPRFNDPAIGLADEVIIGQAVDARIGNGMKAIDLCDRRLAADPADPETTVNLIEETVDAVVRQHGSVAQRRLQKGGHVITAWIGFAHEGTLREMYVALRQDRLDAVAGRFAARDGFFEPADQEI